MAHDLHTLLFLIDAEHHRIDALTAQTDRLIESAADTAQTRDEIRQILHGAMKLFVTHFLHEHEAMRQVGMPRDQIEAHAIEHDDLMVRLRTAVERLQSGGTTGEILENLAHHRVAFARHRDTADAALHRCLHAALTLPAPVAR